MRRRPTLTNETIRRVNNAVGKAAFQRIDRLSDVDYNAFSNRLKQAGLDLHRDGYLGFCAIQLDENNDEIGIWSNEGFEL